MAQGSVKKLPKAFKGRRFQSVMGLWLVLFLIEHLFTNSLAALPLGDDGMGFVKMVNSLHDMPYLHIIEFFLLAVPILVHMIWGILYLRQSKINSEGSKGAAPSLTYSENKRFTWQRVTAFLLVFGICAHVVQMRFIDYPQEVQHGHLKEYFVKITHDEGLYSLANRLEVGLFDKKRIDEEQYLLQTAAKGTNTNELMGRSLTPQVSQDELSKLGYKESFQEYKDWVDVLSSYPLKKNDVIAVSNQFGKVVLLTVRDTFKSPQMLVFYTILVLTAVFHACNGIWTFFITWGVTITQRSQRMSRCFTNILMIILSFWGLIAVWGSYWWNLRQ